MEKQTSEAIKDWLRRYQEAARDSAALDSRVANARAKAEATKVSRIDGMPHATGYAGDSLGAALARIDELEGEAREARAHAVELYHEVDAAIKQISGPGWPDQRAVLQMRYLDGCRWAEIAEMLFGGDPDDYAERQDSFVRRVHKLHAKALAALTEFVPLDEGQEVTQDREDMK